MWVWALPRAVKQLTTHRCYRPALIHPMSRVIVLPVWMPQGQCTIWASVKDLPTLHRGDGQTHNLRVHVCALGLVKGASMVWKDTKGLLTQHRAKYHTLRVHGCAPGQVKRTSRV